MQTVRFSLVMVVMGMVSCSVPALRPTEAECASAMDNTWNVYVNAPDVGGVERLGRKLEKGLSALSGQKRKAVQRCMTQMTAPEARCLMNARTVEEGELCMAVRAFLEDL